MEARLLYEHNRSTGARSRLQERCAGDRRHRAVVLLISLMTILGLLSSCGGTYTYTYLTSGFEDNTELPTEPLLRLEIGMHTSRITRLGIDAANRYLVTGSVDKTVRVWELATGRLQRTIRL